MKLTITEIQEILPHRYPFLLLDSVEEVIPGERVVAKKNVTVNEQVFKVILWESCFLRSFNY